LTPIYYRDAKGAVLVYDSTVPETFNRVKKWAEELNNFSKDGIKIVVAGNKVDMGAEVDKDLVIE
jgi:Ras-related protein Rab-21